MKAVKNEGPLGGIEEKTGVYPGMARVDRLKLLGIEQGGGGATESGAGFG